MKKAITGASGYLGRSFISMYGDEFDCIAVSRAAGSAGRRENAEYRESDYSVENLRSIFAGCDAVVHLAYAMATKENEAGGMESYRSGMDATRNVLAAAHELGIRNIVFASSRLVYPNYTEDAFHEDDELQPQNHYARSKVIMEELCEEYNRKGTCIKVLRFGQIIGADMKVRGMFSIFMEKAAKNEPLTLIGSDVRDYIYVKDACRAIAVAVSHPDAAGIYNISMGTGIDNRIMAADIIRATGSRSEVVIGAEGRDKKPDRIVLNCGKAMDELGFQCQHRSIFEIASDIIKGNTDQS